MNLDPDTLFKDWYVTKLRILYAGNVLLVLSWIYLDSPSMWMIVLSFYVGLLISRIGSEAGFHRLFSHNSYQTSKFKEKLLLWWGTVMGVGSCLSWATMHRLHHAEADRPNDPHSPHVDGWVKPFFGIPSVKKYDHRITKDLIKNPLQMYTHRNYFKLNLIWISFWIGISLLLNSWLPVIIFVSMASISLWILYGVTNTIEHQWGYRTYDVRDKSKNQPIIRLLWLGAGLHNNHHFNSQSHNFNLRNNWWEFDFDGWIIDKFFANKLQR